MAKAHDVRGTRGVYVSHLIYPKGISLPLRETDVETREVRGEYRIGRGRVYRVPFTRLGVVVGRWSDERPDSEFDALLVATGMHASGMTEEQAQDFRTSYEVGM